MNKYTLSVDSQEVVKVACCEGCGVLFNPEIRGFESDYHANGHDGLYAACPVCKTQLSIQDWVNQ